MCYAATMSNEDLLSEVSRRLIAAVRPSRIVAFGSRVRGDSGQDSDLDLVVVEDGGGSPGDRSVRVRTALAGLGVPLDVLVYTTEEFERLRKWRSSIVAIAEREGRLLYERGG